MVMMVKKWVINPLFALGNIGSMVSSFYFILGIVSMVSTSGLSSMILIDFSKCTIFFLRLHITDLGYPIGHFRVNHLLVNDFFIQVGNTAEFYKPGPLSMRN